LAWRERENSTGMPELAVVMLAATDEVAEEDLNETSDQCRPPKDVPMNSKGADQYELV